MAGRAPRPTSKSISKSAGSSARRPSSGRSTKATSNPRRPSAKATPASRPQRGSRATNRLVVLVIVLGALVISYGSSLQTYLRQSRQIDQLRASIASLEAQKAADAKEANRLNDPARIEELARIRFGWVMPGQTPYVVVGAAGQPVDGSSGLNTGPPTVKPAPVAWWAKETASLANADNPPPAPLKTTKQTPSKKINGG